MASIMPAAMPPLIEPIPITEEFVSGPAFLRTVGPVTFIVFYIDQIHPPESGMTTERRISHRLVMPAAAMHRLRNMIDAQGARREDIADGSSH